MKILTLSIIYTSFFLLSCNDDNVYFLSATNSYGINENMKVFSNDKEIGRVTGVQLVKNRVIIKISMSNDEVFYERSLFKVINLDILNKAIFVENNSSQVLNYGDTIQIDYELTNSFNKNNKLNDSKGREMLKILDSISR